MQFIVHHIGINFLQILKVIDLKHNSETQEVHHGPRHQPLGSIIICPVVPPGGWSFIAACTMHMMPEVLHALQRLKNNTFR